MELILRRTYFPGGTNGELRLAATHNIICYTIELPWKKNLKSVSCIPEGRYPVKMRFSRKFGLHFILTEVKDRNLILIHPANDAVKELRGCIAPVTTITGEGRGIYSVKAFTRLRNLVMSSIERVPVFITIKQKDHDD